ncbi:MAG: ADOP family duplicated permease [Vicinamibacterales bacterium]
MPDIRRFPRIVRARIRALVHRDAVADEIREELQFHLRMRAEGYQESGESPEQAVRHARQRVGNLALLQDRGYDVRGGGFVETVVQDARYAIRQFARQPGFTSVAILTLALGIGLSTALFSVIDAALLHPLPYPHPEQLVTIYVAYPGHFGSLAPSPADIRKWRDMSSVIAHIGSGRVTGSPLIIETGVPQRLVVGSASEDFFEAYGITPVLGRSFRIEDTRAGAPDVALLGHAFWESQYGGDPGVLGRMIRIQNAPVTIVGVLPAGFYNNTAVWQASHWSQAFLDTRGSGTPVIARLQPRVTPDEAARQLTAMTSPDRIFSKTPSPARAVVTSLYEDETSGFGGTLRPLGWAVALIVVIACVNVAGLLLARGATRRQELAVRASIGAGRGRLVRQLLVESLLLAFGGSIVGIGLAYVSLDSLVAIIPLALPANSPPTIDATVLSLTLVLTVLTALCFGLVPALKLSHALNLHTALAGGNRDAAAPLSRRSGQWLIAVEVALALILVSGAALMIRSFSKLLDVNLGYDPSSVLTLEVEPVEQTATLRTQFYATLQSQLLHLPDVSAVGAIDETTLTGGASFSFLTGDSGVDVDGAIRTVLPGYFEAVGLRPLQGRLLTDADRATGEAALISASGNAKYFNGAALGHTATTGGKAPRTFRIVGVVADLKHGGPQDRWPAQMYVLPDPRPGTPTKLTLAMILRLRGGSIAQDRLKQLAASIGPRVVVGRIRPASDLVDQEVARPRHRMLLLTLLGGFGLLLTLVGIFGMTAYAVARRTREIGVRIAIGATPGDVLLMMLKDVAKPVAVGIVIGLAGAAFATRVIASFLFETTPTDPATFTVVALTIAVAAAVAAWIPSRRALRVDPVSALRAE